MRLESFDIDFDIYCLNSKAVTNLPELQLQESIPEMEAYFPVVSKLRSKSKRVSVLPVITPKGPLLTRIGNNNAVSVQNREILECHTLETSLSSSEITTGLLQTLSDVSNPITHSNIAERSDCIVSFSTGHQVSEGRKNHLAHTTQRADKLRIQQEVDNTGSETGILKNTKIYIGGYLESTTDIEMKRLVIQAGGQVVHSASQCTHIITSRGLSASKTDRILTRKTRTNVYVVKPDWVFDSISIGKRRSERSYAVVKSSNTLQSFLGS